MEKITEVLKAALQYAGLFFVSVVLLIALTWVGLGVYNLIKLYWRVYKANQEYKNKGNDART